MNIVHLTVRMSMGWGVAVVIGQIARHWTDMGLRTAVGCIDADGSMPGMDIAKVDPNPRAIDAFLESQRADIVVAHASPYFEALPHLTGRARRWAYEHGDPTPGLFGDDAAAREVTKQLKLEHVYPAVDGVIAISRFVRHDIQWPAAHVVMNGCDHIPDRGCKQLSELQLSREWMLRVGTLMRLGRGEADYKGNRLFIQLAASARKRGIRAEFLVMGRGSEDAADEFRREGITVILDASDEERQVYLRNLDIFVSPSLWEGFNLPLVEAQAAGTLGIAFDTGSHPEVTPFIFSSVSELGLALAQYAENPQTLWSHSRLGYHFVRQRFSWRRSAEEAARVLVG